MVFIHLEKIEIVYGDDGSNDYLDYNHDNQKKITEEKRKSPPGFILPSWKLGKRLGIFQGQAYSYSLSFNKHRVSLSVCV